MNIYLDIDNTIILNQGFGSVPAIYLDDFLLNALNNHQVYWLSTHCNGSTKEPIEYLKRVLPEKTLELVYNIKPTTWSISKSEAISLDEDFLWFDDILMPSDKRRLLQANRLDSFVLVDLKANPNFFSEYLNI